MANVTFRKVSHASSSMLRTRLCLCRHPGWYARVFSSRNVISEYLRPLDRIIHYVTLASCVTVENCGPELGAICGCDPRRTDIELHSHLAFVHIIYSDSVVCQQKPCLPCFIVVSKNAYMFIFSCVFTFKSLYVFSARI